MVGAALDPKVMRVADVMTTNLITISPETTIEETMIIFAEKRCRHLLRKPDLLPLRLKISIRPFPKREA